MAGTKGLAVAPVLKAFIETEALPGTGIEPARFWEAMERILRELAPATPRCWPSATTLQAKIDAWHRANPAARSTSRPTPPSCARSATCCPSPPR
jgi:malate synthase